MTFKKYYSWQDVTHMVADICRQLAHDEWKPDYVVGITRGGNIPATMISQYLGCGCHALKVSLRDDADSESNLWMAEDAFNYNSDGEPKKILIVDDINDTGATFNWIMQDWQGGCLPDAPEWNAIWGRNVRFAVLTDNLSSNFEGKVDYYADEVNKAEDPVWLVYPWEEWWKS